MLRLSHLRRLLAFAVFFSIALVALGVRLYCLQVVLHDKYKEIGGNNTQRIFLREPRRGDILDANGHPLATSYPVKKLFANPRFIGPYAGEVARVIAPLLSVNQAVLAARLRPIIIGTNAAGQPLTNSYVNLKQKITVDQWLQITQALGHLVFPAEAGSPTRAEKSFYRNLRQYAIYSSDDQQRYYPSKTLAAHVLGFTAEEESDFNEASVTEITGVDGIERWLNPKLSGVRGWRTTETDRRKREIVVHREQEVEPRPGLNVVLTIDMVIQNILETELADAWKSQAAVSACGIVVRPRTGEILAMASLPDYDPNNPGVSPADARRNRVISDVVEPGSTFKVVVVSAALNEGLISLSDSFDCEHGKWPYMGKVLHDHGAGYGVLTVENIITKSSNIGAAKIAVYKLGEQKLYDYCRAFGFGGRTGITLSGELNGILNPVRSWDKVTISRIPMGQSIAVTPLQMMMAMGAIANEGRLMRPMLIKRLQESSGEIVAQYEPQMVRQVVKPSAARDLVQALKTVVAKDGTAPKAALEHYTVAGKTGTAQKVVNGVYGHEKYIASFIGFFPADNPEICISILLDEPDVKKGYYGGQTAAPYFKAVAEQCATYLKIRPDKEETPKDVIVNGGAERVNTAAVKD